MKTAFVYSDALSEFDYGVDHPLKTVRLKLTYELIKCCKLLETADARLKEPALSSIDDLLTFHSREYIDTLKAVNSGKPVGTAMMYGLGPGDNPIFPGVFEGARLVAGASLLAASLVDSGQADIAFNIGGGLHHAMPGRASGFCYINDPVIAILSLVKKGRRIAYIDIDAHHGDGVQAAFYNSDRVLTISLHETGTALFPGTGFEDEIGTGKGKRYSVNIPLPPESDDELFLNAFNAVVPDLIEAFKPDIVVSQLGVDAFRNDPLSHLNYTTSGFCEAVKKIKALSPKWVALGGGGYDLGNVARAWTLAWSIMNDTQAPEDIPEEFLRRYGEIGIGRKLRDQNYAVTGSRKTKMKSEVDRIIRFIKDHALNGE